MPTATRCPPARSATWSLTSTSAPCAPSCCSEYAKSGYCWVVIGSLQAGRSFAQPKLAPQAIAYYAQLANQSKLMYHVSPFGKWLARGAVQLRLVDRLLPQPVLPSRPGDQRLPPPERPVRAELCCKAEMSTNARYRPSSPRAGDRARRAGPRPGEPEPAGRSGDRRRWRSRRRGLSPRPRIAARRGRGDPRRHGPGPVGLDDVRVARALLSPRPDPALHRRDPRGRHPARGGRLRRSERARLRTRPGNPARRGRRGRRRRGRSRRTRPAAQPAVSQARPDRPPLGAVQVGDDARRQGCHPQRRLEVDLRARAAAGAPTTGAESATPWRSESGPR